MAYIFWDHDEMSPKELGTKNANIPNKQLTTMKKTKKGKKKC